MIREIGSVYQEVKYMKDRIYIRIDDADYAVQGEWIKFTYKVTKKGDVIIGATLATAHEIEEAKRIAGYIELDKIVTEELGKAKEKLIKVRDKAKVEFKKAKQKLKEKFNELKDKLDD